MGGSESGGSQNGRFSVQEHLSDPEVREGYDEQGAVLQAARLIRRMREAADLSQDALAERIGTSQPHLSALERGIGRQGPTFLMLWRIARACRHELRLSAEIPTIEMDAEGDLIASDAIEGAAVYTRLGERSGTVRRLLIHKRTGQVAYAWISLGGFLGIGETPIRLRWNELAFDARLNGYVVDLSQEADQRQKGSSSGSGANYGISARERASSVRGPEREH